MALAERRPEKLEIKNLGVYEESAPLKKVLMWGKPGAETILGQLLPKKISCFEEEFNVPEARREFGEATAILKAEGIEIIQVKDLFAEMVLQKGVNQEMSVATLKSKIETRAHEFYNQYKDDGISDVNEVLSWLDKIIDEDVERYGEKAAVIMNNVLSLQSKLPLSNVLYARDQSNLLGGTWIWSSMRHQIRQPEVSLFKNVLSFSGLFDGSNISQVQVSGAGRFEGGDGIVNNGAIYIGVGGRTNMEGIMQAAPTMLKYNEKVIVPIDEERDHGTKGEMDAMHLDTIWMPSGKNQIVACEDEVSRRKIIEITKVGGKLKVTDGGWFADHLAGRGVDLIPLTKDEQERYAPNFLNLGNDVVVLSLAKGNKLTERLGAKGKKVYNANLVNITKGYGGLHCMTASVVREK